MFVTQNVGFATTNTLGDKGVYITRDGVKFTKTLDLPDVLTVGNICTDGIVVYLAVTNAVYVYNYVSWGLVLPVLSNVKQVEFFNGELYAVLNDGNLFKLSGGAWVDARTGLNGNARSIKAHQGNLYAAGASGLSVLSGGVWIPTAIPTALPVNLLVSANEKLFTRDGGLAIRVSTDGYATSTPISLGTYSPFDSRILGKDRAFFSLGIFGNGYLAEYVGGELVDMNKGLKGEFESVLALGEFRKLAAYTREINQFTGQSIYSVYRFENTPPGSVPQYML